MFWGDGARDRTQSLTFIDKGFATEQYSAQDSAFESVVQASLGGNELELISGDPVRQPLLTLDF